MKNLRVKICPKCGNQKIELVIGGQYGMYECKECGFRGSIFPERELKLNKKTGKKKLKNDKNNLFRYRN